MSLQHTPTHSAVTPANLDEERRRFTELQGRLSHVFKDIFPHRQSARSVVIVPSHSLDSDVLAKVSGIHHYEERLLCLLILLRLPRTNLVFVTSQPIHDSIIDYYLHLLPGVPSLHAKQRLTLLSCYDSSPMPLTQKILERRLVIDRICKAIDNPLTTHLACFNVTEL